MPWLKLFTSRTDKYNVTPITFFPLEPVLFIGGKPEFRQQLTTLLLIFTKPTGKNDKENEGGEGNTLL